MTFENFLKNFEFQNGFYIPINQLNEHRHFGIKKGNKLLLTKEEVLYLYDNQDISEDVKTNAYFELKKSDFNILRNNEKFEIFKKTKHFNRNKDKKLFDLKYVKKDDKITEMFDKMDKRCLCAVLGDKDFTFLELEKVDNLNKNTEKNLSKK